jgi:hypothetical protein
MFTVLGFGLIWIVVAALLLMLIGRKGLPVVILAIGALIAYWSYHRFTQTAKTLFRGGGLKDAVQQPTTQASRSASASPQGESAGDEDTCCTAAAAQRKRQGLDYSSLNPG